MSCESKGWLVGLADEESCPSAEFVGWSASKILDFYRGEKLRIIVQQFYVSVLDVRVRPQLAFGCPIGPTHQVARSLPKKSGGESQNDGENGDYRLAIAFQNVSQPIEEGPAAREDRAGKSGAVFLSLLGAAMLAGLFGYLITGRQQ